VSIETDVCSLLTGDPGVAALVAGRVALNAVNEGTPLPYIIVAANHAYTFTLDKTISSDEAAVNIECWGRSAAQAEAVGDAVAAAVLLAPPLSCATLLSRIGGVDPENGLDASVLTVEWWA
jgi:Protein of unknown function (DUF3168)